MTRLGHNGNHQIGPFCGCADLIIFTGERPADLLIFTWLYRSYPQALDALIIVKPATVVRWHRAGTYLPTASVASRTPIVRNMGRRYLTP